MVLAALVFFDPAWPRRRRSRFGAARRRRSARRRRAAAPGRGAGASCRGCDRGGAVSLRRAAAAAAAAHLYGGNVLWHEQGMRFSWRVMVREKNGSVDVRRARHRATGREWHVPPAAVPHAAAGARDVRPARPDPAARAPHRATTSRARPAGRRGARRRARLAERARPRRAADRSRRSIWRASATASRAKRWITRRPASPRRACAQAHRRPQGRSSGTCDSDRHATIAIWALAPLRFAAARPMAARARGGRRRVTDGGAHVER